MSFSLSRCARSLSSISPESNSDADCFRATVASEGIIRKDHMKHADCPASRGRRRDGSREEIRRHIENLESRAAVPADVRLLQEQYRLKLRFSTTPAPPSMQMAVAASGRGLSTFWPVIVVALILFCCAIAVYTAIRKQRQRERDQQLEARRRATAPWMDAQHEQQCVQMGGKEQQPQQQPAASQYASQQPRCCRVAVVGECNEKIRMPLDEVRRGG